MNDEREEEISFIAQLDVNIEVTDDRNTYFIYFYPMEGMVLKYANLDGSPLNAVEGIKALNQIREVVFESFDYSSEDTQK